MPLTPQQIRDYIDLDEDTFEQKHGLDYLDVMNEVDDLDLNDFSEDHVASKHYDMINDVESSGGDIKSTQDRINAELTDKGLKAAFIEQYIQEASKGQQKINKDLTPLRDSLKSFSYHNRDLTLSDLREELEISRLTYLSRQRDTELIIQEASQRRRLDSTGKAHEESRIFEEYMPGINSLLEKIEQPELDLDDSPIDYDDIFGYLNPKLTDRRVIIYNYWDDVFDEYGNLKTAIKGLLDAWDKMDYEEDKYKKRRKVAERLEDLDEEFEKLADIYNKMDDNYNYVLKLAPFDIHVTSTREGDVEKNATGIIINYITKEILGDTEGSTYTDVEQEEIEADWSRETEAYEFEDPETKTKESGVEVEFGQTQADWEQSEIQNRVDKIVMPDSVDPIFAISEDTTVSKLGTYSKGSHQKMLKSMKRVIRGLKLKNIDYEGELKVLLDKMQDYSKEAVEVDREEYHLPMTEKIHDYISKYPKTARLIEGTLINLEEMEEFHKELLEVVSDILEAPTDKSILPLFVGDRESVTGASRTSKRIDSERMKYSTGLHYFRPGEMMEGRNAQVFGTHITGLVDAIFNYYIEPSEGELYPFRNKPSYLDSKFLTTLQLKGPDSQIKTIKTLFMSLAWASIKPSDLRHINNWLKTALSRLSDPLKLAQQSEDVMKVLERLAPNDSQNDKYYFANKIHKLIQANDNLELGDLSLNGEPIEDLSRNYDPDNKPSLWKIIKYIHTYKEDFKHNDTLRARMKEFLEITTNKIDTLMLSDMERNFLNSHDEIRKMLGKPIYYARCRVDDIDNIGDTIDLMKSEYNIEVTANDIIGIVSDFNSMNQLGKKYGVNDETVYHIKSLYRW